MSSILNRSSTVIERSIKISCPQGLPGKNRQTFFYASLYIIVSKVIVLTCGSRFAICRHYHYVEKL